MNSNLKEQALESLASIVVNNMLNTFNELWRDAETAGEVSESDEFVKPFVKRASKEMIKRGWVKSPLKSFAETFAKDEMKEGVDVLLYIRLMDSASYTMTYGLEEKKLNEIVKAKCFEETARLYLKLLETQTAAVSQ